MRINQRPVASAGPSKGEKDIAPKAEVSKAANGDRVDLSLPLPGPALVHRASEGPVKFRNDQGGTATLQLTKQGEGKYELTLDGKRVPVEIDAGIDEEAALSRIADYYSQLPAHMREGLKSIEITDRKKEGVAATTYNGKRVVFWEGLKWLTPGVFFHEMGHVHAQKIYGHTDPSDAWDRAQAKDNRNISVYSKTNDNEDFAEMTEAYWLARRGEGAHTVEELRAKFPERMKIVEDVAAGRPVETQDSDYWRVANFNIPKPATIWNAIDGPGLWQKAKGFLSRLNPFN